MMQYPNNFSTQDTGGDRTGIFSNQLGMNYFPSGSSEMPSFSGNYSPNTGVTGGGSPASSAPTGISNGTALGQVSNGTYNPMAGWDVGKLNDPSRGTSAKYQFGRFVQDQKYDPIWARSHMNDIAQAFGQKYGMNARGIGDDKIDFGNGWGPIDLLNSGNYWQWLVPNAQGQQQGNAGPMPETSAMMQGQGAQPYVRQGNFLMNNRLGMYGGGRGPTGLGGGPGVQ